MVPSMLGRSGVPWLACSGLLFALLLRRLWCVHAVAAAHRKRLHSSRARRAWVELPGAWHTPLLLLGLAIAAVRIAFFAEIHEYHHKQARDSPSASDAAARRRWLWIWLDLPSALVAIVAAYLLFFLAHIALFRVWPLRFGSTALSARLLLIGFSVLLCSVVALVAHSREREDSVFTPSEWTRLSLKYSAVVWIVLGAVLLKFQGMATEVLWAERDAGRMLVVGPRGIYALLVTGTTLALVLLLRGTMSAMLATTSVGSGSDGDSLLPRDLTKMKVTTFLAMYAAWEVVVVAVIYQLCACVPVTSRARRLVGEGGVSETGRPICAPQPVLHFALPSPKQAVESYLKSASIVIQSRSRRDARQFEDTTSYATGFDPDREYDDHSILEGGSIATAHEPLLSAETDGDDDETYNAAETHENDRFLAGRLYY